MPDSFTRAFIPLDEYDSTEAVERDNPDADYITEVEDGWIVTWVIEAADE